MSSLIPTQPRNEATYAQQMHYLVLVSITDFSNSDLFSASTLRYFGGNITTNRTNMTVMKAR